jgi:hypothetical protein
MSGASQGRRAAHRADRLQAKKPGERTGSRPKSPEAGAPSASLEPGRSPGYPHHHSCSPKAARSIAGRSVFEINIDPLLDVCSAHPANIPTPLSIRVLAGKVGNEFLENENERRSDRWELDGDVNALAAQSTSKTL